MPSWSIKLLPKLRIIFICLVIVSCTKTPTTAVNTDDNAIREVISNLDDFSGHIMIADQEQILFNDVFGESAPGSDMTNQERWRLASITKQLVAVAIMQMVEENQFSLDTTVNAILLDTKVPNAKTITIRNLLQHTSGLINDADLPDEDFINGFDSRGFCTGPAKRFPGQSFEYNNCDYIVLGQILEKIDQKSWFDSLDDRIFQRADMTSIRIGEGNGGETVTGFIKAGELAPGVALSLYEASGELVGTVDDLVKFDRALLSGKLLKRETREVLWDSDPALGYAALGQWVFPGQLEGCDAPVKIVERRGAISGVQVLNALIPEKNTSIVVFVNRDDFDWGAVWAQQGFAFDLLSAALCSP